MKIAVIGAGKTGRGFLGRLIAQGGKDMILIDKNARLVQQLKEAGSFRVHFFGDAAQPVTVDNYTVHTWEDADLSDTELILVSVGGTNLEDVGAQLKERLDPARRYWIITCENATKPAARLKAAIGMEGVLVSESTVFCTTIEKDGLDISSENYPYLQFNADLLEGYVPEVAAIRPVTGFGNFLTRKLFTYNAASCVIAYLGWLYGYSDYAEAANDPRVLELLDKNYAISNRVLCREFGYDPQDQEEFAKLSKAKFCSRVIVDTVARNAREPQRKLGPAERVIGPMLAIARHGEDASVLEMTAAAMLMYDNDGEDAWRAIKAEKTPGQILTDICQLEAGSPQYENILRYYHRFTEEYPR